MRAWESEPIGISDAYSDDYQQDRYDKDRRVDSHDPSQNRTRVLCLLIRIILFVDRDWLDRWNFHLPAHRVCRKV